MALKMVLITTCFSLSMSVLCAQTKLADYDRKWAVVDSLLNKKGLPESALSEVGRIYALASKEHNDAQRIKALIYRIGITEQKQEDTGPASIKELETAAGEAGQPARSILQNQLAGAYWNYFQRNRWKLYNRTNTVNFEKNDIATWTIDDFHKKVSALYLASLKDERLLEQTRLDNYEPILIKGNSRYLRPTLFDLLAHEALDYFMSSETDVDKPANVFEIDDPAAFSDAAVFAGHVFVNADSSSLHFYALQLFQRLIRLHLPDARPDALIDVDLERLAFVNSNAVLDNKEGLYRQSLVRITGRYGELPAAAQAWYLQAELDANLADKEEPEGDTSVRKGKIMAKAICDRVLGQPDSSEGKTNCRILLNAILQKELVIEVERVNLPGKPMRALVSWRNFTQLQLRLVRLDSGQENRPKYNWEKGFWEKLFARPVYRSFTQALPATEDFLQHRTEIAIGSLPPGTYALMAATDEGWVRKGAVMTVQYFYISSIAFINQGKDFFVVNRESGQPLDGANVQVWEQVYNSRNSSSQLVRVESFQTDKQGHFFLGINKKSQGFNTRFLDIHSSGDRLFMTDQGLPYFYFEEGTEAHMDKETFEKRNARAFLFLDRAIYRPGQTVFFKGIMLTRDFDTRQSKIWTGRKAKLLLYNANGEKLDSLELTSNAFGSYHGVFRLPEHQLNGQFRIADESGGGSQSFSVEEYKRPGFYIEFDKQKVSYRVGDSVRVFGNAKAYAGNNLDGATVNYRIVRRTQYPHPWLFWRTRMPMGGQQEISHGRVKTDSRGAFQLVFAALPDHGINKSSDPLFEYKVEADVTDINGETRSGETQIIAGYKVINLSIDLADGNDLPADSLKNLLVSTTNLAGAPVSSRVHITIYPLQSPDRLIRERLWDAPDRFVLPEAVFRDSFPHDEYRQETKKESWPRGTMAWDAMDSTRDGSSGIRIPAGRLTPGWWVIEARTTDGYGQEVVALRYVDLYDGKTGRPASPRYSWTTDRQQRVNPGGKAVAEIGSSATEVHVIRMIERPGNSNQEWRKPGFRANTADTGGTFSYFNLSDEKKRNEWTVTEADRGGFGISDVFVKDNRLYTQLSTIRVPWTNKELQIHYTSYRDKTEPGSGEKWAVTISGDKGEGVSAELLTSMYDASLDQFAPQSWSVPGLNPVFSGGSHWENSGNFQAMFSQRRLNELEDNQPVYFKRYDRLLAGAISASRVMLNGRKFKVANDSSYMSVGVPGQADNIILRGISSFGEASARLPLYIIDGAEATPTEFQTLAPADILSITVKNDAGMKAIYGDRAAGGVIFVTTKNGRDKLAPQEVKIRKNFNETAFFFPDLRTDSAGNVSFSFTMPEALTRWKWMVLAHSRNLAFGYSEKTVLTQKQLMMQPNIPRFLREGDQMNLSVKLVNLTDSEMTGQVGLQLTDPTTGETADGWFVNRQPNQYFTVEARSSAVVDFPLDIPFQYNRPLGYRLVAQSGNYSDGEEATLPVVSNRMLVTETLPLNMPGDGTRQFQFGKLLQSGSSETLSHHALTVEFTANPAWYAVQALPYLMEYPYECAEQTFNRFYANALASRIVNSSPRLRQVFDSWRTTDTAALLSNLQKNQDLKSILLEETPWVLQGKTEEQQKKNIVLLFDLGRMSRELESTIDKLKDMQTADGGFVWFKGGRDDRYITQYILTGIGRLQQLQAIPASLAGKIKTMVAAGLSFVDEQIRLDYEQEKAADQKEAARAKTGTGKAPGGGRVIGELPLQYLYARSFFNDYGIPGNCLPAVSYYRKKAQQEWPQRSKYLQGMIALALFRTGDVQTGRNIIASLRQSAIRDEEKGMYWKGMDGGGYYWYQAPIEIQSLLIEAFREIGGDPGIDRGLKTWLLRQKQTHSWPTTKATADACYALLLGGQEWLNTERAISIQLGDKKVEWGPGGEVTGAKPGHAGEAGTGYYKKIFDAPFVNPSMGNITVTMKTLAGNGVGSPAWGAVYWQYFDQLDHITPPGGTKAPLRLVKKLFVQRNTDRGPVLDPLTDNGTLKVGDRVVVRIELRVDRSLEYVHMKDMRAACLEPVNVLSQYKWQGGLGYYETTKDASSDFFFPELTRGTYVFEYTLLAGQTGNFSNGVTSVECMYAPEFAFHSEGIRVNVEATP